MKPHLIPIRHYRPSLPFSAYSSRNKKGGRTHPRVARARNRVLDLWSEMADYDTIAEVLDISISTIVSYIKRARMLGDPRVDRPYRNRKIQRAAIRRRQMAEMSKTGMTPRQIAERLDCSVRLVEIRLKEMNGA